MVAEPNGATSKPRDPGSASNATPKEAKPVADGARTGPTPAKGRHGHRSRVLGQHLVIVLAFSLFGVGLDVLFSLSSLYEASSMGGYAWAQGRLRESARPSAVVVDLDAVVPPRLLRKDPTVATDPEWKNVASNWQRLADNVRMLQKNGARAVFVDWELALADDYVDGEGRFKPDRISSAAQTSYLAMLKTLLDVDRKGCPVVVGADWVNQSVYAQRAFDPTRWFPVPEAARLAGSLYPAPLYNGFSAQAFSGSGWKPPVPPASEVIAERLGDHLGNASRLGFSPYAETDGSSQEMNGRGKIFWIDHSTVAPDPRPMEDVKGMIVVLASASPKGDRGDTEVVPDLGSRPGGFYHAAAIGTRVGRPLDSFSGPWSERGYLFLFNLVFGLFAVAISSLAAWWLKLEHHTPNIHFVEFWVESGVAILAGLCLYWFAGAVAETRLMLPGVLAALLARLMEPGFTLIRYRKLVSRWKEAEV